MRMSQSHSVNKSLTRLTYPLRFSPGMKNRKMRMELGSWRIAAGRGRAEVAQNCILLYRRISFCGSRNALIRQNLLRRCRLQIGRDSGVEATTQETLTCRTLLTASGQINRREEFPQIVRTQLSTPSLAAFSSVPTPNGSPEIFEQQATDCAKMAQKLGASNKNPSKSK